MPAKSDCRFKLEFEIDGLKIKMRASTDKRFKSAVMLTGAAENGAEINAVGFDAMADVDSSTDSDFRGIHGRIVGVKRHSVTAPKILGYDMKI